MCVEEVVVAFAVVVVAFDLLHQCVLFFSQFIAI
jgi:hypothetical protein